MNGSIDSLLVGLSRQTVMATNGMLALASDGRHAPVDAQTVAAQTGSGVGEICDVLSSLQQAGLVRASTNGSPGFRLTRSPSRVSLYDIAEAVGEPFDICTCFERRRQASKACAGCPLEPVFRALRADLIDWFKTKTIGDLTTLRA